MLRMRTLSNFAYILGLVDLLDQKKIELPVFVAVKLHRLPKMTPSDVDTVNLAETVADLKHQVSALTNQLQQVSSMVHTYTCSFNEDLTDASLYNDSIN